MKKNKLTKSVVSLMITAAMMSPVSSAVASTQNEGSTLSVEDAAKKATFEAINKEAANSPVKQIFDAYLKGEVKVSDVFNVVYLSTPGDNSGLKHELGVYVSKHLETEYSKGIEASTAAVKQMTELQNGLNNELQLVSLQNDLIKASLTGGTAILVGVGAAVATTPWGKTVRAAAKSRFGAGYQVSRDFTKARWAAFSSRVKSSGSSVGASISRRAAQMNQARIAAFESGKGQVSHLGQRISNGSVAAYQNSVVGINKAGEFVVTYLGPNGVAYAQARSFGTKGYQILSEKGAAFAKFSVDTTGAVKRQVVRDVAEMQAGLIAAGQWARTTGTKGLDALETPLAKQISSSAFVVGLAVGSGAIAFQASDELTSADAEALSADAAQINSLLSNIDTN